MNLSGSSERREVPRSTAATLTEQQSSLN
uniref:Uncharacterized protein n=1 Tax=Anguilla anguilla TaxID=7936 RepID=A0A0E9T4H9_ANGAN